MSTATQSANTANAQLSTGPRTEEGKRNSSQNARTHGLTAQHFAIADQDRAAFQELHTQLQAETKPQGALQKIIFEELVHAAWKLGRVRVIEAELDPETPDAVTDRLARHHTRIERCFYRALHELKALQTDAALSQTLPPYFMKIAPPLASRTQIAKRTQFIATNDRILEADDYQSAYDLEEGAVARILYHQSLEATQ